MSIHDLNNQFAAALGLPRNTRRAVLTLEVGEIPKLLIETMVLPTAREVPGVAGIDAALSVKQIPFMVRLEPFQPGPARPSR